MTEETTQPETTKPITLDEARAIVARKAVEYLKGLGDEQTFIGADAPSGSPDQVTAARMVVATMELTAMIQGAVKRLERPRILLPTRSIKLARH